MKSRMLTVKQVQIVLQDAVDMGLVDYTLLLGDDLNIGIDKDSIVSMSHDDNEVYLDTLYMKPTEAPNVTIYDLANKVAEWWEEYGSHCHDSNFTEGGCIDPDFVEMAKLVLEAAK